MTLNKLAEEIHTTALEKGWWDQPRSFGDIMMMIVSECAEAVEHYRDGAEPSAVWYENTKPDGVPAEFADIIIRVLDAAHHYGIDLDDIVNEKMKYNHTREYRHGGKLL